MEGGATPLLPDTDIYLVQITPAHQISPAGRCNPPPDFFPPMSNDWKCAKHWNKNIQMNISKKPIKNKNAHKRKSPFPHINYNNNE